MSLVVVDNVTKVYRSGTFGGSSNAALRGVSFEIASGEVVSLIGESGSGKSTLGKIMLRLLSASGGRVVFEGQEITALGRRGVHEYYRNVQGVFQDPFSSYNPLYKADRVFEVVRREYFADIAERAWRDKVDAALATVALNPADVLNKFPHQLSGGQQQRLLVARALLLDIKLLVADEIISMLDASTRVDVLNMLVGLKRQGLAILFITHDLSLGNYISDKTIILRHGAVVEMGDTPKVFGDPQHPYTRSLLTAVPQLHRPASSANGLAAKSHTSHTYRGTPAWAPMPPAPDEARAGPVPSLMDLPGQQWRRGRPRHPKATPPELGAPPLVEYQPGHLVASSSPKRPPGTNASS